jgi:N6-L-threonylcarbamoyladenine synthase
MRVLGIETSCDETAAAVVENGQHLLSNVVASSSDLHVAYGGVVPEIAARSHIESDYSRYKPSSNRCQMQVCRY